MLSFTHYTNGNIDWCVVGVGKGVRTFGRPSIQYTVHILKGNSEADPTGKSNSNASNSGIFSLTHARPQCAHGGGWGRGLNVF